MTTYVLRNGKLVEKYLAEPINSSRNAPSVISDTMAETRHMATGEIMTSKSKFSRRTRELGMVEIGNDTSYLNAKPRQPIQLDRGQRREAIRQAFSQLRNGR